MDVLADGAFALTSGQIALLISAAALLFAINHWRRNALAKRNSHESTPPMPVGNPLSMREITAEVQALLADLEETSRRLTAQLDNRYTRLEQLMAEADERIRKLEGLSRPTGNPQSPPVAGVVADARQTLARLRHERGAPPATDDPAYQPVYSLADRGKSPREIAQELGRQPGEIELILALRQKV